MYNFYCAKTLWKFDRRASAARGQRAIAQERRTFKKYRMLKLAFFLKIENSKRDDNRNIDAFPIRDFFDMVGKPHRLIAETLRDDKNISRHPEKTGSHSARFTLIYPWRETLIEKKTIRLAADNPQVRVYKKDGLKSRKIIVAKIINFMPLQFSPVSETRHGAANLRARGNKS